MIASHYVRIALVSTLMACSRSHEGSALDIRNRQNAGSGQAGAGEGAAESSGSSGRRDDAGEIPGTTPHADGATTGAGAPSHTTPTQQDMEQSDAMLPMLLAAPAPDGREVFVGQLWTVEPTFGLCSPDMPDWVHTTTVTDPTGYTETATLVLEHVGEPDFGGSIRFGEGEPPTSPGDAPFADGDGGSYWLCSRQIPTRGVEYRLHDAKQYPDRLTFSIVPGEVWNAWCAMQTSPCGDRECKAHKICQCTADGCTSFPPEADRPGSSNLRLSFNLAITASTIEGQPPLGSGFGTPADLRLQRQR
jgi:hypothetical protein